MGALDGRHALVTGSGGGVGAAIARALAAEGAAVTLAGRRLDPLVHLAGRLPKAQALRADVTREDEVQALFAAAREAQGPVDIVVANAGAAESAPVGKTSLDLWERTLAVNLTGSFLCAREGLAGMPGWGRVVFVASTAGLKGYSYVSAYVAAKHGVVGLTRALALEVARRPVTVNAVCPGFTETPMLEQSIARIMETSGRSEAEARKALMAGNPQGRFVQPEEVANAVLWLTRPGSEAVTGQAIVVAGGEL